MAATLVGMVPLGERQERPPRRLRMFGRWQPVQPFDGLPVPGFFRPATLGFHLRQQASLLLTPFRFEAGGLLGVLAQQGDPSADLAQAIVQDTPALAPGGAKLAAAFLLDRFPMEQGLGQRVGAVLFAAEIAERALARAAALVAVAFYEVIIAGAAGAAEGDEGHGPLDSIKIPARQPLQIPQSDGPRPEGQGPRGDLPRAFLCGICNRPGSGTAGPLEQAHLAIALPPGAGDLLPVGGRH
jgi:hypothetical protein